MIIDRITVCNYRIAWATGKLPCVSHTLVLGLLEQSHQKFTFVILQLPKVKVKKARPSTTTSYKHSR